MVRFVLWRLLGALAALSALAVVGWFLGGGPGRALRRVHSGVGGAAAPVAPLVQGASHQAAALAAALAGWWVAGALLVAAGCAAALIFAARWYARRARRYVRLQVAPYRNDSASARAVVAAFDALHKRVLVRWWRRLLHGQPSIALELHYGAFNGVHRGWLALCCPSGCQTLAEAALRDGYPNCRLGAVEHDAALPASLLRLKKRHGFIKRVKLLDRFEHEREPSVNRVLTAMSACHERSVVQLALTPAPPLFERLAKHLYKRHEAHLSRARREHLVTHDRSLIEDYELRGALEVQHRPLFFTDLRILASTRKGCERIASELRAEAAENSLVERGTLIRHGLLGLYARRIARGEGNPLPGWHKGVFASTELAALWQLPSSEYSTVPVARSSLPLAPASPSIMRPHGGQGTLRDALGPVCIHPQLRKHNTAVPGAVDQGKTSFLVATIAEDLSRERCAVIVIDPKGDAAEAAMSLVPADRTCTLLDLAKPTCGFNPLAVDAPADVIADYVVAALKNLFTDVDIRASSDRYLRNAIIAVLAFDPNASLWDAARLLSVGEEGYAYRRTVGARVRELPEIKEISSFFTEELSAQLADSRSATTAKLDAPVNKLARLLNSPSIKRVLLNDSLRIDFDRVIAQQEVLVVKGALGTMGAGNTAVIMQLLMGMLDAALARQQDLVAPSERIVVALKVDEAPLVLNRGFADTMALKRSAGLETVACWQTESQWTDREIAAQLDALFAHRVYFATASAQDARAAVKLTMAEFSDSIRPGIQHLSALGHPDVRLHLPKHHVVASWCTPEGRQAPFLAQTIPLHIDHERLAAHAARQLKRGGHALDDLRQRHWMRADIAARPRGGSAPHPPVADPAAGTPTAAAVPAASYRELVELDRAQSVRWARKVAEPRLLAPDELDLQVLGVIASLRHVLSTQLHRRFNPSRAATTTQRRLKRLSDAGLVERFQFHRRDGGGVPMCYVITQRGCALLAARHAEPWSRELPAQVLAEHREPRAAQLRQARHEVHVSGWALALMQAFGPACTVLGPELAAISPPARAGAQGRVVIGPGELKLPHGRAPHDFLHTQSGGELVEVERFETVRPDAIVQIRADDWRAASDVLVELDDRLRSDRWRAKLERYDHFLAGWCLHTERYGRRARALAVVVFVCRDRARARDCARGGDQILRACRAYAGDYPFDWEYPGRAGILFAAERDVHEGQLLAYGVPRLPPHVRVGAKHGDPRAGEATAEPRLMLAGAASR